MPGSFLGRLADRGLAGHNYDSATGRISNVGPGLLGTGAKLIATLVGGPAAGYVVGKAADWAVDKWANRTPDPVMEHIAPIYNTSIGYPGVAVNKPPIANLGLGPQSPGNSWAGYMQSPGSVNNFGNTQFGTGTATQAGSWSPSSAWGQVIASNKPANPGSVAGFGNNVGGFITGDTGRTAFSDRASKSKGTGWQTIYQRSA